MNDLTTQRLYHDLNDEQLECIEKLETCNEFNEIKILRKKISNFYRIFDDSDFPLRTEDLIESKITNPDPDVSEYWKNFRVIEQKHVIILKKHFNVEIVTIESSNQAKKRAENLRSQIAEFIL
jgi:hypothetical protein